MLEINEAEKKVAAVIAKINAFNSVYSFKSSDPDDFGKEIGHMVVSIVSDAAGKTGRYAVYERTNESKLGNYIRVVCQYWEATVCELAFRKNENQGTVKKLFEELGKEAKASESGFRISDLKDAGSAIFSSVWYVFYLSFRLGAIESAERLLNRYPEQIKRIPELSPAYTRAQLDLEEKKKENTELLGKVASGIMLSAAAGEFSRRDAHDAIEWIKRFTYALSPELFAQICRENGINPNAVDMAGIPPLDSIDKLLYVLDPKRK